MMSCMWCELQTCHTWLGHVKSWRWVSWVCGNCFKLSSSISVNILFYRIGLYCESIILIKTKQKSLQFSCSVVSDSLRPHESQHTRPPCPSPTPGVYPNSCPSSQWCHPAISSSIPPSIGVFSNESTLCMRWPKYWSFSFSISPSNEHPGLIFFRLVGSPCKPRDSQESSPTPQFRGINSLVLSFLHSLTLTSIHDHWKNHSLD